MPLPRRSAAAPAAARSSRWSPAATSISRDSRRWSARAPWTSQCPVPNFCAVDGTDPLSERTDGTLRAGRRFPAAFIACTNSRSTSGGAGRPTRARCSAASTTAVAGDRAQPGAHAARDRRSQARGRGRGPGVSGALRRRASPALDDARGREGHLVGAHGPGAQRQGHRLLLGRVRAAPVAADLRRRPRRAGRRSLQGSQRSRRAADRRRLHVSAGLLPPADLGRRLAGRALRAPELDRRADRAGDHPRRQAVRSRRCRSAIGRCWRRCGACASAACGCSCSTPTSKKTRRGIASCRRGSTAAIARPASSRRSSSASAACACCARSASSRRSGTSTRATRRSSCCSASASSSRAARPSTGARGGARRPPCSRRTRRCRPATTRFRSSWSRSISPAAGARSASTASASWRWASTTTAAGRSST